MEIKGKITSNPGDKFAVTFPRLVCSNPMVFAPDTTIKAGDKVRSFDFEHSKGLLEGPRACYVEGTVCEIVEIDGCDRYKIQIEKRMFGGKLDEISSESEYVYPPVNGTRMMFGDEDFTNFVVKMEWS